jgi:hypothetical protein
MKIIFIILSFCLNAQAETTEQKASQFFDWLNRNEKLFIDCEIKKENDQITLCDQTQVSYSDLKKLFSLNQKELIQVLKKKNIQVEVICESKNSISQDSKESCLSESSSITFKKVSSLHGLYVPDQNKIIIRSQATNGTLLHEYLHYEQSQNKNKIDGHIYKTEKNKLRQQIEADLDQLILEIKKLEINKEKEKIKSKVDQFMKLNNFMLAFGQWQDLIDERSLFLLFLKFEKDFSIQKSDIDLARKNLKFICQRKDFKFPLSKNECAY